MARSAPPLVLASASAVRTRLLTSAGVTHIVDPADVDEGAVRDAMLSEQAPHFLIAEALAELKAQRISQTREGALVLGADQVLSCDGILFTKPPAAGYVRAHLEALMGRHTVSIRVLVSFVMALLSGMRPQRPYFTYVHLVTGS